MLADKKLIDEGKIEELLTQRVERMKADFEAQVAALEKARDDAVAGTDGLTERLAVETIDNRIMTEAAQAGARKGAIGDITARARTTWGLNDAGEPTAYDAEKNPIFGADGSNPLTMKEWIGALTKDAGHLFEPQSKGGGADGGDVTFSGDARVISDAEVGDNLGKLISGEVVRAA